jgi:hypothetical protein
MSIPSVPLDLVDAVRVVEGDVNNAMVKVAEKHGTKKVSMSMIIDYFFQQCGFPTSDWNFCDALFVRYFTKVEEALYVGKAFSAHAACFLTCICLIDRAALVQLVIDVYSDGEDGGSITLGRSRLLIENLLDLKGGDCQRYSADAYEKFLAYARSTPTISIKVNVPEITMEGEDEGGCVYYTEDAHVVSTQAVHSFFAKKHRFIFWPLEMFQAQLQRVFMGEDFWATLKASVFCQYLKNKGVTADTYWFAEVLQKMYTTSLHKMKVQGTLAGVPFDRKPEVTVTPRNKKTKLKLPPEAYAIKKKVTSTPPQECITEIKKKSSKMVEEETSARESGVVNPDGTIRPRSSKSTKSTKNNGPSPLSGKYNAEDAVVERNYTSWNKVKNYFAPKPKVKAQHTTPSNKTPTSLPPLSPSPSPEPATPPSQPNSSVPSSAESGEARKGEKYIPQDDFDSERGASDATSPSKQSATGRLLSSFNALLSTSSSTPNLSGKGTSPPKTSLPSLFSKDDSGTKASPRDEPGALLHRATVCSLSPIPKPTSMSSSSPSSPREALEGRRSRKEHSDSPTHSDGGGDGSLHSPRRSIKLEKIKSKNALGSV